jgi:putative SOS response-associated peptidase YedK
MILPMCGRFASTTPPASVARLFKTAGAVPNAAPSWNVAPSQPAMVVRRHPETGERRLVNGGSKPGRRGGVKTSHWIVT